MMNVTVTYAEPDEIWSASIVLATSSTVAQAIQASGFLTCYNEYKLEKINCGIYGKIVTLREPLKEGDRVEIYRNLYFDPKQSRRRRAIHRQKVRSIKKKVPINDVTI